MHPNPLPAPLSRRAFLGSLPPAAALLAAAGAKVGAADPATAAAFTFIQVNDLHYLTAECDEWLRAVMRQMKASAPAAKFCLLCGDLADQGTEPALAAVKTIFSGLGVPLYAVPGNHDFSSDGSREAYDTVFPAQLNHRFAHNGWQFVGLDSTMGTKYDGTTIGEPTLAWLDAELPKMDPAAPTVIFTHFPLGENVTYTPLNAPAVLERLVMLNLVATFSGHWHGASERQAGAATLLTSRCCARIRGNRDGSPLKGWHVCEARPDGTLTRKFVAFQTPEGIPAAR